MTCYTVYLYNKDADVYSDGYVCKTEEEARLIADYTSTLLKASDIELNYTSSNYPNGEPFDWIEIVKYSDDCVNPTGDRIAVYPQE